MATLEEVCANALRVLVPPPHLRLSQWIEETIRLPEVVSALPGPVRLWPWQYGIADAITDPLVERVTLVKPTRCGFTTLLTSAIGSFVSNDPCPVLAVLPTEADARDYMVSDVEPIFAATLVLRGALAADTDEDRNTLLSRRFPGGSLKVVAAKAPRNLRRHTARVLLIDEADACQGGGEGNPLKLAEQRTLSFGNRKIIIGSTPIYEDTSHVLKAYAISDGRVFEVPCPACGGFTEVMWEHIVWEPDRPETAAFKCPHCAALIDERHKGQMVADGQWRATRPEVIGHAGFRLNALVSLLTNASWAKLAAKFIEAKDNPDDLQAFINTDLAQGWREAGAEIDETSLQARAEPFGLDKIPKEVLVITAGVDGADDRFEVTICGWTRSSECLVLGHVIIWGSPDDDSTWAELDDLLKTKWRHPLGGMIGVDGAVIDSGDGQFTDRTYSFCFPRTGRRIMAGKGMFGARPSIQVSKGKIKGGRLWIVGVDTVKNTLFSRLQRAQLIRFSDSLEPVFFEQLASERRVVRYSKGRPVRRYERISGRAKAEALDCVVYNFAARSAVPVQLDAREANLRNPGTPRRSIASLLAH